MAEGVAFRLGATGFFAVVSALGLGAALGFSSAGFATVSGFALATFGEVAFLGAGFAAAAAFLTVVFALVAAALTAAVDDFVASRGERRVGPVAAFFAGILVIEGYERGFTNGD